MKWILLSLLLCPGLSVMAQESGFKVNDEVEYFDGVNWIDSKILEVGSDGRYLLMLNHNPAKTKWFYPADINLLNQPAATIVEAKVEESEKVVGIKFHVGDKVQYEENGQWTDTEIIQILEDYTYQVYTDTNRMATTMVHENYLKLISSEFQSEKEDAGSSRSITYRLNESIECYVDERWQKGNIQQITEDQEFVILLGDGQTYATNSAGIRKPAPNDLPSTRKEYYDPGDKVLFYNGSEWVTSEIIQINQEGQLQVFYNAEQTATKWIDPKDVN